MEDFTTLNNPRFLYTADLHEPYPDWVASQPIPTQEEFSKQASAAFADPARRLLPIGSKLATFYSALNVFAHCDKFSEATFERVKSACQFFDIEKEVAPYAELFAGHFEKSASATVPPAGRFAVDTELDGQAIQLFPLNDELDIRQSARDLAKMAFENRIGFSMLWSAAGEVVKAASEYGVLGLPDLIYRIGMERLPDLEKVAALLEGRERLVNEGDREVGKKIYQEIGSEASAGAIDPEECMHKIAAADESLGVIPNYRRSSKFLPASEVVFSGRPIAHLDKLASENVLVLDKVLVPLGSIKNIDRRDLDYKLSKEAAAALGKVLDTDDAQDISLVVMNWGEADQKTLLRMAAA